MLNLNKKYKTRNGNQVVLRRLQPKNAKRDNNIFGYVLPRRKKGRRLTLNERIKYQEFWDGDGKYSKYHDNHPLDIVT